MIFLPQIFLRWIHPGGSYLWVHGSRILRQIRTILTDLFSLTGDIIGRGYPHFREMQMGLANGAPAEFIPCGNPLTPLCPRSGLGSGLTGVLRSGRQRYVANFCNLTQQIRDFWFTQGPSTHPPNGSTAQKGTRESRETPSSHTPSSKGTSSVKNFSPTSQREFINVLQPSANTIGSRPPAGQMEVIPFLPPGPTPKMLGEPFDFDEPLQAEKYETKSMWIYAHTKIDNGDWVVLRFLVDTGATMNVLHHDAIPQSMQTPLTNHRPLVGVTGTVLKGTHSTSLQLQLDVKQPQSKAHAFLRTPATFFVAELPRDLHVDGILSFRWLAQRNFLVDPANRRLIVPPGWTKTPNLIKLSHQNFNCEFPLVIDGLLAYQTGTINGRTGHDDLFCLKENCWGWLTKLHGERAPVGTRDAGSGMK